MSYGLALASSMRMPETVPVQAQALPLTRFPHLVEKQRTEILRDTALPSGSALLDGNSTQTADTTIYRDSCGDPRVAPGSMQMGTTLRHGAMRSRHCAKLDRDVCRDAERRSCPYNYRGSRGTIGLPFALRPNARRARTKTDQRKGFQWKTRT
jgi:hypothetical protein